MLDKIVGPCQSSFIPGRQTTDNVIITQEILHSLENSKIKEGGMIFKINLEKAYDCNSWCFLKKVLKNFNLNDNWIDLIMSCISQGETSILWNGQPFPPLKSGKGLR